jgi:hypothetical protein
MDSIPALPPIPTNYSNSGMDFSIAGIGQSQSLADSLPSLPSLPALSGVTDTATGVTGASNASSSTANNSNASPTGCSWYDIGCWGSALLGRIGIVVLGLILLALAVWMLAPKVSLPVPVPV